ncbi:MAG: PAS domain-containing protein, partial [Myxococcota bacterium]
KSLSKPLRLLAGALQLPAMVLDVRGRIAAMSPEWADAFGPGASGPDAFFADVYPSLTALHVHIQDVLEAPGSREHVVQASQGDTVRRFIVKVGTWTYDDGTIGGSLLLAIDDTARLAQAAAVREANERLDLVLAGASVGVWDWMDVQRDEQYWSPRFYSLLGIYPEEVSPGLASFRELLHPDDRQKTFDLLDAHFEYGLPFDINYRLRTGDGSYRWFRGSGMATHDASGAAVRMAGSIEDIDARIKAEADIQRMNEDLEHFAHVVAHDLREPMRRQQVLLDFFLDDHEDHLTDDQRQELGLIQSQGAAMMDMINGFRMLTRLSGPGLVAETFSISAMARAIVDELLPADVAQDVSIDLPDRVRGYRVLVDILLRNLIANAITHGAAPRTLTLQMTSASVFVVENQWDGDPDTITGDFLQPFVAGRNRTSTGLGLSICRRVVNRHRGWIRLAPTHGTFRVEFTLGPS